MNSRPKNIAVLGAGQIGAVIARMLAEQGHRVTLADASASQLAQGISPGLTTERVDASDLEALRRFLSSRDIVVSALPYFLNRGIARIAVETKTHYFDLTEDVATRPTSRRLALPPTWRWCRNAASHPASSASSGRTWRRASTK